MPVYKINIEKYCEIYPRIYPHNIAECLNIKYSAAEAYFFKYRRIYPDNHNSVDSISFFKWYLKEYQGM